MASDVFRQMHACQQPNGRHKLSDLTVGPSDLNERTYVPDLELRAWDGVEGAPCVTCGRTRKIRLSRGRICRRCGKYETAYVAQ